MASSEPRGTSTLERYEQARLTSSGANATGTRRSNSALSAFLPGTVLQSRRNNVDGSTAIAEDSSLIYDCGALTTVPSGAVISKSATHPVIGPPLRALLGRVVFTMREPSSRPISTVDSSAPFRTTEQSQPPENT